MPAEPVVGAQAPSVVPLVGPTGWALTVDVEEWYHTCHVPEFVHPERRPRLPQELDRLLPELLDRLAAHGCRATFFTLGEVAARLPRRVREIAAAGHEVASHGFLHRRAGELTVAAFRADVARSQAQLADVVGEAVVGFRAPEWSLRRLDDPRLAVLAELGFRYDSSLAPWPGAGSRRNPWRASLLAWGDGRALPELPPLGLGLWRLPACGWTGRMAGAAAVARAAADHAAAGGLPVLVVHPWEISTRPTPGELTGLARFLHETGRGGYWRVFEELLGSRSWSVLRESVARLQPVPDAAAAEGLAKAAAAGAPWPGWSPAGSASRALGDGG
ncbi:MAG TPA: polysaccharide deacetylase family protein [Thermoanaerobaculia bacterium]|nr:polysaccharide deacetylase family protein [Thermoanaerobaculia bacterium]